MVGLFIYNLPHITETIFNFIISLISAEKLGESHEHPVQEMEFFNIGGAKVFYYYGLDTVRSSDHVMGAGPHVRDTCIGVLMLDQYKIQERPGEY